MAVLKRETGPRRRIVEFNVNLSCSPKTRTDRRGCRRCEKYLFCRDENKWRDFEFPRMQLIRGNLKCFRHRIAVMAGKGGVGKSTVTVLLAVFFASEGFRVTVLDQDFDGPSIPVMLGMERGRIQAGPRGLELPVCPLGIQVASVSFFPDMHTGRAFTRFHLGRQEILETLLAHSNFGERDFLIVDLPAGTSSDTANVLEYVEGLDGVVIVTMPSLVSLGVVRRVGHLCRRIGVRILGVVENMSGHVCPFCGYHTDPLGRGGGDLLAEELEVPLIGRLPYLGDIARYLDGRLEQGMTEAGLLELIRPVALRLAEALGV